MATMLELATGLQVGIQIHIPILGSESQASKLPEVLVRVSRATRKVGFEEWEERVPMVGCVSIDGVRVILQKHRKHALGWVPGFA